MSKFDIFRFFCVCHLSKLFGRVNEDTQVRFVYPASPFYPVSSQNIFFFFLTDQEERRVTREGVCALANRLFVFPRGRGKQKGDLGRQRGLLLLTAPLQARQAISGGDGRNAPAIVLDSDLHTRAGKSQTN